MLRGKKTNGSKMSKGKIKDNFETLGQLLDNFETTLVQHWDNFGTTFWQL